MTSVDVWVRTSCGETFRAFTWTADPEEGKRRAAREAEAHGYKVWSVWTEKARRRTA